jgi:hypothetical protein
MRLECLSTSLAPQGGSVVVKICCSSKSCRPFPWMTGTAVVHAAAAALLKCDEVEEENVDDVVESV